MSAGYVDVCPRCHGAGNLYVKMPPPSYYTAAPDGMDVEEYCRNAGIVPVRRKVDCSPCGGLGVLPPEDDLEAA